MYDAHSTASLLDSGSLVSPSGSSLLFDARSTASTGTSGDGMHDAPSSAFSNSLHRLSSDGTNASSGSGTEWFEAGDADSDAVPRSGSFRRPIEGPPEPEQAQAGRRLDLALFQAADSSAAGMLGHAEGAAGSVPGGCALLRVADAEGETSSAAHLGPAMLRIFTEVLCTPVLSCHSMHGIHCSAYLLLHSMPMSECMLTKLSGLTIVKHIGLKWSSHRDTDALVRSVCIHLSSDLHHSDRKSEMTFCAGLGRSA